MLKHPDRRKPSSDISTQDPTRLKYPETCDDMVHLLIVMTLSTKGGSVLSDLDGNVYR